MAATRAAIGPVHTPVRCRFGSARTRRSALFPAAVASSRPRHCNPPSSLNHSSRAHAPRPPRNPVFLTFACLREPTALVMAQSALSAALSALSGTSSSPAATPGAADFDSSSSSSSSMGSASRAHMAGQAFSPGMRAGSAASPHSRALRQRPPQSSSFPSSLNSVPVSPNMFPFSPPMSGVTVRQDKRRRGSSVVTTTVLSPYGGELVFSSSFDEHEVPAGADDDRMDMDDMDVDEMDLNYKSDTDEEDWQSAGVESLRRGDAFHLMKDAVSSSGSESGLFLASSRASVSSSGTTDTKLSVYSQSVPMKPIQMPAGPKRFGMRADADRQEREADAIQALVQLRSL